MRGRGKVGAGSGGAARSRPVEVEVVSRLRRTGAGARALECFGVRLAREVPAPAGARLSLCLLSDAAMRRLNGEFRGKWATTDVLAFPGGGARDPEGRVLLGDIAISVPRAAAQARGEGHSVAREVRILALHGYLHLLGYDHETDRGEMKRLEGRLARRLLPRRPAGRAPQVPEARR